MSCLLPPSDDTRPGSPITDPVRLTALAATGVLAAPSDAVFDRMARLAARVLGAPTALVSLVDADRQVFAGCAGLAEPWCSTRETPLSHSFCQHVVVHAEPLVIPDARLDPRVAENLAVPVLGVVAYAGVPLVTPDGQVLGSLCVIDGVPRAWTPEDVAMLEDLAQGAAAELALRRASRTLAAREAALADLLEHTDELACCTDADGRLTLVNGAWRRTLGYTDAEAATRTAIDLVAPDDRGRVLAVVQQVRRGESVREFEAVLVARDGQRVICRGWAVPQMVAGPDGAPVYDGARIGFHDVTVERAAESARARLASALDASPDFAALVAPGGQLLYLNRAGRQLVGLPEDASLASVSMVDLHPVAARARLVADALPAARSAGSWTGDSVLIGANGAPVPVAATIVSHVASDASEPALVYSLVARDLRDRARAEDALRASEARAREAEARFRAALHASPDASYLFEVERDTAGQVVDFAFTEVNAAAGALYGMPPEDLIGHTLGTLFPLARASGSSLELLRRTAESGVPYEGEYRTHDPRATAGWLWLQVVPIRVGEGPVTGLAVTARDITARKRTEGETRLLQEVTASLATAGDVNDALVGALGAMCRAADLPYGEVWTMETASVSGEGVNAGRRLVRGAAWHDPADERLATFAAASSTFSFAPGVGLPGCTAANATPIWIPELTTPGTPFVRVDHARRAGLRTGVGVPVVADGEVVAVFAFHARQPNAFDANSRALLTAVGAQIGSVVSRRHAEAMLREREAELRLTQDAGGLRGWTLDLVADELRLAPGTQQIVALPGSSAHAVTIVPGAVARATIHGEDVASAEADLAAACADPNGQYLSTYRVPAPNGGTRWVRATGRLERDPDGTPRRIRGVSVDITEERALRARAEHSEAELRALFGAMRDVVIVFDAAGTYVDIVATAPDLLYMPAAAMLGRRMHDVLPPTVADALLAVIGRVLDTGAPDAVEYALDRPGNGRTWYAATVSPLATGQVLWVARDVSAQKRAELALRELSTRDDLTGLLNRRGFRPLAEQSLKVARRSGLPHALLSIDLDGFKAVNDTHGHAAGDAALQAIARVLRDTVREGDLVARLGGDEFAVYAGRLAHSGEGHVLAARLHAALAKHNTDAVAGGRPWTIGMSVGVAEAEPGDDLDQLLARGDAALYAAKARRPARAS